ncbi:MAG: type II toxin-antitoxin system RelE family toxin [Candidatus Binatia bacterium]
MSRSRVFLSETARQLLRHLHPDLKSSLRKALDGLASNPFAGKPLQEELAGLWSLSVARYRIIYQIRSMAWSLLWSFLGRGGRCTNG